MFWLANLEKNDEKQIIAASTANADFRRHNDNTGNIRKIRNFFIYN